MAIEAILVTRLCQNRRSWRKKPTSSGSGFTERCSTRAMSVNRSRAHTLPEPSGDTMNTQTHYSRGQVLGKTFLGIITEKILNTQCRN